jgi:D-tyrosyl-tRNA(Tyr) deacylase
VRAVVQRVTSASVRVGDEVVGSIEAGLCVLLGVTHGDDEQTADRMADKLWQLRIFEDDEGRMNRSAANLGRSLLVVSQFTLYADTSRGRRPSFVEAAPPEHAEPLVSRVVDALRAHGAKVATGRFRADMAVTLVNDGPVTIVLEV